MKLSLIITTYNRPDALEKVIQGVLNQSRMPEEVLIADDGSTVETAKIVKKYSDNAHCPFHHVWQEDKGFRLARIRNKAINKACGNYIVLIDGDCIPEKNFIRDHFTLAERGFFFQGKRVLVNREITDDFSFKDTVSKTKLLWLAARGKISNAHHIYRIAFLPARIKTGLGGIRGCNMGFFKDDLMAVNGFNEDFKGWGREDSEIVVRLFNFGLKRKEHPFRTICFHLFHHENNRDDLTANDQILDQAILSKTCRCSNGLLQENRA